jgi:hypothetical protein
MMKVKGTHTRQQKYKGLQNAETSKTTHFVLRLVVSCSRQQRT